MFWSVTLKARGSADSDFWEQKERDFIKINYKILIFLLSIYYIAGMEFEYWMWRCYNNFVFWSLYGQRSRHFWPSNWVIYFTSNSYTLLQGSVCLILQVIPSIPSCKLIEETCERIFTTHFDYCTTASTDFVLLDESTFSNILEVGSI